MKWTLEYVKPSESSTLKDWFFYRTKLWCSRFADEDNPKITGVRLLGVQINFNKY